LRPPAAALPSMLAGLATVGAAGNVTVPHKEAVERCVARKTELCARVGACNTFWTEHGALVGDNTDVAGIQAALRQLGADGAGSWLLVGTGGAARAVAVAAAAAKADLHVLSRDAARARDFAAWARGQLLLAAACLLCRALVSFRDSARLVCDVCRHRWRPVRPPWCVRCGQPEPSFGRCRLCAEWPAAFRLARSAVWLDAGARDAI